MSREEAVALAEIMDHLTDLSQQHPPLEDFALSLVDDIWREIFARGLTPSRFLELTGVTP
jgi:hypothetical protein